MVVVILLFPPGDGVCVDVYEYIFVVHRPERFNVEGKMIFLVFQKGRLLIFFAREQRKVDFTWGPWRIFFFLSLLFSPVLQNDWKDKEHCCSFSPPKLY